MKKFICLCMVSLILLTALTGCKLNVTFDEEIGSSISENEALPPVKGDKITPTDYSVKENWLKIADTDYPVDVFFLYPTAWLRQEGEALVCDINNKSMRDSAPLFYNGQAKAYETAGNVYAPFYRQVDAVWITEKPLIGQEKYFEGIPYTDAVAAFEYYLENYNNGKPFILAGHSQGSAVTKAILKYYMKEHPEVYERMVAAYIIGYFVTEDELKEYPHLKFAENADDTGVIVSWNAEAPETGDNPLAPKGSVSINPLNWKRDETPAAKEENLGSEIFSRAEGNTTKMEKFADATVNLERGTVVCTTADVDTYAPGGAALFPRGVFHAQDYGFYFYNIRANAENRAAKFLNK